MSEPAPSGYTHDAGSTKDQLRVLSSITPGSRGCCGSAKNGNVSAGGTSLASTLSPRGFPLLTRVRAVSTVSSARRRPLGKAASGLVPPRGPELAIQLLGLMQVFRRR